jgi:hypothetical protein
VRYRVFAPSLLTAIQRQPRQDHNRDRVQPCANA